jgi:hypothetical protein
MAEQTVNLPLAAGQAGLWWAGLVVAVLVLGAGVLLARRACLRPTSTAQVEAAELERLQIQRDSGQISEEEFAVIRRKALNLDSGGGEKDKSKSSDPGEVDDSSKKHPGGLTSV